MPIREPSDPGRARLGRPFFTLLAAAIGLATVELSFEGCSSTDAGATGADAAAEGGGEAGGEGSDAQAQADARDEDAGSIDGSAPGDASGPTVTSLAIVTATGAPLRGAPGDAIPLAVVLHMSDGTTQPAPPNQLTWLAPPTLTAEDPDDPGSNIVPDAGAQPTAFFVHNTFAQENTGVLYVLGSGSVSSPAITVTAAVADAGQISASFAILPAPVGDPVNGEVLFHHGPECATCHGPTGGGSPPALFPDGGPVLLDGGPAYDISGQLYPYPAPGLNNAPDSGNVASDPAWNAALLALAAQSDMDNEGVALRKPMPDWFGGSDGDGGTLSGQDFADIYAWLKTQTQ